MNFRVPIFVYRQARGYVARPLFFRAPERSDDNLNRLLAKLTRDIVAELEKLGRDKRHDAVAALAFCPRITAHRIALEIELRRRIARVKYLVAAFDHMNRRLAFTPAVPELWFELGRNETLDDRALAVLTEHWRQAERDAGDEEEIRPEANALSGKAWVQVLELSADIPTLAPKPPPLNFLMLGGADSGDGASELRRVGRCIDWLYPDELERAILREREVSELNGLLAAPDRRPVLLCGPRMAGKTAIVHECVYRRVEERKRVHVQKQNLWLISPQRLISGMCYVGQWEGRLLAILKHASRRDHVLYLDDLIGLFLAGVSSCSSLSAAIVLKPYLERRDVRVLGEISPESLRILQERDRGFADLFHIIPVREPDSADNQRILIEQQRRLEGKHACNFGLDVLPAVIDLQRRYDRTAAFPGKAAVVLNRLSVRATATVEEDSASPVKTLKGEFDPLDGRPAISRDDVLLDFAARSGLALAFLDPRERLDRDTVRDRLGAQVIGQTAAVEALADVVSIAKARLNDPERPLAAFLFLGPTGVGKTECAKAIARTLFGDSERLLRIDLNEFNQPGAAARLVGTFSQPEGLLTSAIQRQPFAVILLDEIEKADPEVFDLLLAVLGEGRLTDALGRTANFSNAIIILTSNLGVRGAEGSLGFTTEEDRSFAYIKAAEKFFRPEFFNRLDRIIPFQKLSRDEMGAIARRLVNDVLAREGFGQRKCVLNVAPQALDRVIAAGYDPALGARAMKRAIERELTQPAASKLAELSPDELTIVTINASDNRLTVNVQAPGWAVRVPVGDRATLSAGERIAAAWQALDGVSEILDRIRPRGSVVSGKISPEQERYFALKEQADSVSETLSEYENRLEENKLARLQSMQPEAAGRKARYRAIKPRNTPRTFDHLAEQPFRSLASATTMEEGIRELFASAEPIPDDADLFDLENRLALVLLMATAPPHDEHVYLRIRGFPDGVESPHARTLADYYMEAWKTDLGVDLTLTRQQFDFRIEVKGVHAYPLARSEVGTHLFLPKHGGPIPVRVAVVDTWPPLAADPFSFHPILRIYPEGQAVADVRTGMISPLPGRADFAEVFRTFALAVLPRAGVGEGKP